MSDQEELQPAEVPVPKPESKLSKWLKLLGMALLGAVAEFVRQNGLPF